MTEQIERDAQGRVLRAVLAVPGWEAIVTTQPEDSAAVADARVAYARRQLQQRLHTTARHAHD